MATARREGRCWVYVGNSDSGDISVLELAPDGAVRTVATAPVPGLEVPVESLPLCVSPDARLVFAAARRPPFLVTTFAIDGRRGTLAVVGQGRLPASMAYIATDRRGRILFGAAYDEALVSASVVEASGVVGATVEVVRTAPGAHAIQADPANARVLFTGLGGDLLYQRAFDAERGTLRELEPGAVELPRGAGPRHFAFAPDGRLVFVLGELDGVIYTYPYDLRAGLARAFTHAASALPVGFDGTPWAADVHLTPDGRFLVASERTSSSLVVCRAGAVSGQLAPIGSYATAAQPRAFAIDPAGRHVLAVGERSHTVHVHALDATSGALTLVGTHPVGRKPNWVEIVTAPEPADGG